MSETEGLSTHTAQVRLLSSVCPCMPHQIRPLTEGLSTHVALVCPLMLHKGIVSAPCHPISGVGGCRRVTILHDFFLPHEVIMFQIKGDWRQDVTTAFNRLDLLRFQCCGLLSLQYLETHSPV